MKKVTVFFSLTGIAFFVIFLWWHNGLQAINTTDKKVQIFVVEKGQGIREIANKLKKEGLIRDAVVFFLLVKKEGLDGKIQAGDFRLSPSQTALDIAENLTHGTLDIWVTIPEGKRAEEIADILAVKIPIYTVSWKTRLAQNEGYLFPDTYLIPKDATIDLVISLMKNNFEKQFSQITITNKNFTKSDIVTIASLVEREAKHAEDRPLVASVIENRVKIGMAIQIDSTIQYALANTRCTREPKTCVWWPKNLTTEDMSISSLYNTYKNPGLPPTPIANPGLASLKAAASPAKTDYLYYISDKKGVNHYATTLEEHNANITKYGL